MVDSHHDRSKSKVGGGVKENLTVGCLPGESFGRIRAVVASMARIGDGHQKGLDIEVVAVHRRAEWEEKKKKKKRKEKKREKYFKLLEGDAEGTPVGEDCCAPKGRVGSKKNEKKEKKGEKVRTYTRLEADHGTRHNQMGLWTQCQKFEFFGSKWETRLYSRCWDKYRTDQFDTTY